MAGPCMDHTMTMGNCGKRNIVESVSLLCMRESVCVMFHYFVIHVFVHADLIVVAPIASLGNQAM